MLNLQENLQQRPKCRVALHVHLEGAIRHETIWEIMRKKGFRLPGDGSLRALKESFMIKEPVDLQAYLQAFRIFMPAFKGDLEAIERIAFEFVEDLSEQSVAYCEAKLVPYDFLPEEALTTDSNSENDLENGTECSIGFMESNNSPTAEDVIDSVLKGFAAGEEKYGTKVRLVLMCYPKFFKQLWDLLRLCELYRDKGVVGIDATQHEDFFSENGAEGPEGLELIKVLEAAQEKGIHRTIHAGEAGQAKSVDQALTLLGAERIGHGYRVIESEEVYQKCLREGIHFEMCPHFSYLTGAIKNLQLPSKRHPLLRMVEDGASLSVSSDCPTITDTGLDEEYALLREWGLTEAHFTRFNFQAALHSFLSPEEKEELISLLKRSYGVLDYNIPSAPSTMEKSRDATFSKPAIKIATWEDRS